jgi:hypothetical protein
LDDPAQQRLMTAVHAIEVAYRERAGRSFGRRGHAAEDLHEGISIEPFDYTNPPRKTLILLMLSESNAEVGKRRP